MRVSSLRCATACRGTRAATTLRAINMNDLALVWPVFRDLNQSGAHGILANVLPFLCVAFIASHYMIKKSGLPKGAWLLLWKCLRHRSLQSLDPITENKVLI